MCWQVPKVPTQIPLESVQVREPIWSWDGARTARNLGEPQMDRSRQRTGTQAPTAEPTIGRSFPLGATLAPGGVNFSVFSRSADEIELLFFDRADDTRPSRAIPIDPAQNRTYHYWHRFVPDVQPGQIYGFRARGPFAPDRGLRFDPSKLLLDPYGLAVVVPKNYSRDAARSADDNAEMAMKNVVVDSLAYDWEGDRPLRRPWSRTIIYEMHASMNTAKPAIEEHFKTGQRGMAGQG